MDLLGILLGFTLILLLNSQDIDMGLSLFMGAILAGVVSGMGVKTVGITIFKSIREPMTLQLMVIVTVVSGLGYILKQTGDLDKMIDSLINIVKNGKILSMLLPALIGTLSVPGGAILSAPMVNESGDRINLDKVRKTASNLFFRHIFLFTYPLYGAIILAGDLFDVSKVFILKYNFLIMLAGIISAYLFFFKDVDYKQNNNESDNREVKLSKELIKFIVSFFPILIIIVLGLVFNVPFHFAVIAGLLIAVSKNLPAGNVVVEYIKRLKAFFTEGVKYKMVGLIIGVMAFKSIVEASGAVDALANLLTNTGLPLSLMIVILGLITGYLTGMTMAGLGILTPIFMPLIPVNATGPYISLLFTTIFVGYLISPIHLCLSLTKEYFDVRLQPVYRVTVVPGIVMVLVALFQVMV